MKTKYGIYPALALMALAGFLVVGCGGGFSLFKPVVATRPVLEPAQIVSHAVTNNPPAVTNTVTGVVDVPKPEVRLVFVTNPPVVVEHTVTNSWVPNPEVLAYLEGAARLNAATNPTPSEPAINLGLKLASGALGLIAVWKTLAERKRSGELDTATVAKDGLQATVGVLAQTVELYPDKGVRDKLKVAVSTASQIAGIPGLVDKHVQEAVAGVLPPQAPG